MARNTDRGPETRGRPATNPPLEAPQRLATRVAVATRAGVRKSFERAGVDVITVDFSEICKFGGAGHCATGPLVRDSGPKLT